MQACENIIAEPLNKLQTESLSMNFVVSNTFTVQLFYDATRIDRYIK